MGRGGGEQARPHYEMSVEAWLQNKRGEKLTKWLPPAKRVHPKPSPPEEVSKERAFWQEQVRIAVEQKRRK